MTLHHHKSTAAVAALCAVLAGPAVADGPPPEFYRGMPNVGDLRIVFCFPGGYFCTDRKAKIWGQVCNSGVADIVVNGPTRDASHMSAPFGREYVGWKCGEDGQIIEKGRVGFYDKGTFVEALPASPLDVPASPILGPNREEK